MAETRLTDLVIPEVFTSYMAEMTTEKSALVQSGVMVNNADFNAYATQGGYEVQIPFFKPLTGAEEVIAEGNDLTVNPITTGQQTGVKVYRGKAFGASDLGVDFSGEDVLGAISTALVPYRLERLQDQLINILDGAFATALASTHVNDISATTATAATIISSSAIIDTRTLLGDAASEFSNGGAIVCHSNVYADLLKANLVEYLRDRELAFDIPTVNGLRIIVDDDVPVDLDGANDDKYTSYIFAPGAVLLGEGVVQYPLEQFRDELGSSEGIIYRRKTLMHLNGMQWTGTPAGATPTDAELATGGNWSKVFASDKNIRVVKLVTNIGAQV